MFLLEFFLANNSFFFLFFFVTKKKTKEKENDTPKESTCHCFDWMKKSQRFGCFAANLKWNLQVLKLTCAKVVEGLLYPSYVLSQLLSII